MAYGLKGFPGVGVKEPNNNGHNNRMSKVILSQNTSKPDERRNKEIESIEGRKEERGNKEPKKEGKKEKKKSRKFARLGATFAAILLALGIKHEVKLLGEAHEAKEDIKKEAEYIKNETMLDINRNFSNLNLENAGKYFKLYLDALNEKYDLTNLMNTADFPVINLGDFYGLWKAYCLDKSGKDVLFDENNFSIDDFNKSITIVTFKKRFSDGDRLCISKDGNVENYDMDNPMYENVTTAFVLAKENGGKYVTDFTNKLYDTLASDKCIGLKEGVTQSRGVIYIEDTENANYSDNEEKYKQIIEENKDTDSENNKGKNLRDRVKFTPTNLQSREGQEEPENQNYTRQADTMNNEISTTKNNEISTGDGR